MTMNKNKDATCLVKMFVQLPVAGKQYMVLAYPSATAESVHMRSHEKTSYFIMVSHKSWTVRIA